MKEFTTNDAAPQPRLSNMAKWKAACAREQKARAEAQERFNSAGLFEKEGGYEKLDRRDEALLERNVATELHVVGALLASGFQKSGSLSRAKFRIEMIAAQTGVMPQDPSGLLDRSFANALRSAGRLYGLVNAVAPLREGPSRKDYKPKSGAATKLNDVPLDQLLLRFLEKIKKHGRPGGCGHA